MLVLDKSPAAKRMNFITYPDAANLTPSGDFTLEFFGVIFDSIPAQGTLWSHYLATGNQRSLLIDYVATALRFVLSSDGTAAGTVTISNTWTPTLATPYDLTFERSGSTCRIYRNGTMAQSGTKAGALFNTNQNLYIGAADAAGTLLFPGKATAIRFTPGVARYNTNGSYTVPTLPLPTS